jgi:hypothetical protein
MIGPHGIDTSAPRGVTRTRLLGKSERVNRQLRIAALLSKADQEQALERKSQSQDSRGNRA